MNLKGLLAGITLGAALTVGTGCGEEKSDGAAPNNIGMSQEVLNRAVLSYMSAPGFTSTDFDQQVTDTDAELEGLFVDTGMVYFSIPKDRYFKGTLEKLTENPGDVRFGKEQGRRQVLGNLVFNSTDDYFFGFPAEDFHVDRNRTISTPYNGISYDINVEELANFIRNNNTYNGYLYSRINRQGKGANALGNVMKFVTLEGEPSLTRFTDQLIKGSQSQEESAQILLDFVTRQIEYDPEKSATNGEILKRPNEVLLTRRSDCENKTVLYASLLEQIGVDYCVFYIDSDPRDRVWHSAIGVTGDFRYRNDLALQIDGIPYYWAETTSPGFKIGESRLVTVRASHVKYIQFPGRDSPLVSVETGKAMKFVGQK